jgi:hypothetical protein
MIRIPAPYLRGLAVLTIGATFVIGHAALAAPEASTGKLSAGTQVAAVYVEKTVPERQVVEGVELAENCYLEAQEDLTPQGETISQIVHECD